MFRCICPSITDRKSQLINTAYRQSTLADDANDVNGNSYCDNGYDDDNNADALIVKPKSAATKFIIGACCIAQQGGDGDGTFASLLGDEARDEQRCDGLFAGSGSHVNSRSRPLYIPSYERAGCYHESDYDAKRQLEQYQQQQFTVQVQQPKWQQQPAAARPTELILQPAKQFENGHADIKPQNSSYMEQFWICAKG